MSTLEYGFWEIVIEKQGRLKLPINLLKSLPETERQHFWITRGFGDNIALWTETAFRKQMNFLNSLDMSVIRNQKYRNNFLCNMSSVECDAQDRFVLPKLLMQRYEIDKEVVLLLDNGKIEIWNAAKYYEKFNMSPTEFNEANEEMHSTHQLNNFENF